MVVGPRAAGKTTTAQRRTRAALRLGRRDDAQAVAADPDGAVGAAPRPLLIDEWQVVPDTLGAVKRIVDEGASPGSFVITGSTRADMTADAWQATGRILRLTLWGLCEREVRGRATDRSPVDALFDGDLGDLGRAPTELGVRDYVDLALRSGFPEAIGIRSARAHRLWLTSYCDQMVLRDATAASHDRDPQRLRRYLATIGANTAGVVNHATLYEAACVNRVTAVAYDNLLELLYLTEQVPAWTTNRLSRLTQTPKRYLVEPALVAPLLNVDARAVVRSADLVGRLLDSYVVAQLRSECGVAESAPTIHHLRQANGRHEVDVVLEGPSGRIVGIEIKAASSVDLADARHLVWLRDELGDQFASGVVFHAGRLSYRLADRIWALPIGALWSGSMPHPGSNS